ncbi:unnamed protein product, partial [Chrysoparadoxa australica]
SGASIGAESDLTSLILESVKAGTIEGTPTFVGIWVEGTPAQQFYDSQLCIKALIQVDADTVYTVRVDTINGIQSNCGHEASLAEFKIRDYSAALATAKTATQSTLDT